MPGLIDAHVHVYFQSLDLPKLQSWPPSYLVPKAARALEDMLQRGFTTVRDTAGADFALAQAIDDGLIAGPRLIYGGPALSQTGGHGDGRRPGDDTEQSCCRCPHMSRIADGPDEVRKVSRDILRTGAAHLKLMLSGGVSTPTDSISSIQYTDEEIAVAVREASVQGKYVTGHAYLAEAIENALALGLRCIEHGNLLKPSTVASFVEHDAFLVPTLVTYKAMDEMGPAIGMSKSSHQKNSEVLATGLEALEMADRGGVKLVYGSDLIGELQTRQLEEFTIRSEVQSSIDVIRSATTTAAELTNLTGKVGVIAPDAHADLLVVDGDPITDISVLTRPDKYLDIVMRAGQIYRDAGK
nr:amidohydrolase family protein [Nocardioides albus]